MDIHYTVGIPDHLRHEAAVMYDEAFGAKFGLAIPSKEDRVKVLSGSLCLQFGIAAICEKKLYGIAGLNTDAGSLTGGMSFSGLVKQIGFIRSVWAVIVFSVYSRKHKEKQLLMDGISVRSDMRGHGVGKALLDAVQAYAIEHGFTSIRLDVIDTNPGAKRLYERKGFRVVKVESFEILRGILGFGGSETLVKSLDLPL